MEIRESIDYLLQARSEIDEELQRLKTKQTILFTDIVGSTTYFDRFGDTQGLLLLYRHDNLVTNVVLEFKGIVVKTIGDSVMAEFQDPLTAVRAAVAIQRRLLDYNLSQDESERLQIRIGIHTGFGFRRSNDLFGDSVNVAARITKHSGPAQIMVSRAVSETIPASEISFKTLGVRNLEGKTVAEELLEVVWTEPNAYDALRLSLTNSALQEVGVSTLRELSVRDLPAPRSAKSALTGLMTAIKMRSESRAIVALPSRVAIAIRKSAHAPVLKSAPVVLAYLTISAGIVVSRTDTRHFAVRENGGFSTAFENSVIMDMEAERQRSSLPTISTALRLPASSPPILESASSVNDTAGITAGNRLDAGVIRIAPGPVTAKNTSPVPTPIVLSPSTVPEIDRNVDPDPLPPISDAPKPVISEIAEPKPLPIERRPTWASLIETVLVPAGTFMMGNDTGKGDEKPGHQVKLDAFQMSTTEITNRQYLAFLEDSRYPRPKDPSYTKNYLMDYPDLPVVNVSYDDAIAFCAWASKKFNAVIRLPTEAEWEFAAFAGKEGVPYPWGTEDPKDRARYRANAPPGVKTVAKDAFPPNRLGLYNMSGNVSEWVLDFYSKDFYKTSPIRNPNGPQFGTKRSVRGGSWADDGLALMVTRRANRTATDRSDEIGFRIVVADSDLPSVLRGEH